MFFFWFWILAVALFNQNAKSWFFEKPKIVIFRKIKNVKIFWAFWKSCHFLEFDEFLMIYCMKSYSNLERCTDRARKQPCRTKNDLAHPTEGVRRCSWVENPSPHCGWAAWSNQKHWEWLAKKILGLQKKSISKWA